MARRINDRTFHGAAWLAAVSTGVVAAWIGLRLGGARTTLWIDDCSGVLAASVACVCCLGARSRHVGPLIPVLLALAVMADETRLGHRVENTSRDIAAVLIALVLLRQALMLRDIFSSRARTGVGLAERINDASSGAPVADARR